MIRSAWLLCAALSFLTSCTVHRASLPPLIPTAANTAECASFFPGGNYQFVHLIEFSMPGGQRGSAMGVTILHGDTIESVLMTVEGFVLFAAKFSDTLTVSRAVPPFDKPGFTQGMMQDIRTIFLPAKGKIVQGKFAESEPVCRAIDDNGMITDRVSTKDHCLQLNLYSPQHQLLSTIFSHDCSRRLNKTRIPGTLELTSQQAGGYSLYMTLISAETIHPKNV